MNSRYVKGRSFVTEAILKAIEEHGPMTRSSICRVIGRDRQEVASVVSRLSKNLPTIPKRLYIQSWVYDDEFGGKRFPRAVYALGSKPDKPKPKPNMRENRRRWREAQKFKVASVFDLGVSLRKRNEQRKSRVSASGGQPLQEVPDSTDAVLHGE